MAAITLLKTELEACFKDISFELHLKNNELTLEIDPKNLLSVAKSLRDTPSLKFELLIDLCGVDYLHYGLSEWQTKDATIEGFSRGVEFGNTESGIKWTKPRFAVVYHFLSITHNHRLRLKTFALGEPAQIHSVVPIWNNANWYEREAFDLYGIHFHQHPDLRRLLTDYGFAGHPFRKDFPLIGEVEVRFDAKLGRVIYQPVSIDERVLHPKVIREDHRYLVQKETEKQNG